MKTDSLFLELEEAPRVRIWFDGQPLDVPEGANLAAALLAVGVQVFRHTPVSGAPRAPYCMMGACFECLVETGGTLRQACMMEAEDGLRISRPHQTAAEVRDGTL
ncbi:(2Fe-2S)-binding protein [Nocardioides marinus]|nr:(2Fe-2S)-binding protein [Nocardioides marinus]